MIWPIVLGADAAAVLMDFCIWVLVLAGSLLLYAMTRWMFNAFIAVVGTFPVVGSRMQSAVIAVRDLVTSYASSHETVVLSGFVNLARDLVQLLRYALGPILDSIAAQLRELQTVAAQHDADFLLYTWPRLNALEQRATDIERILAQHDADFLLYTWPRLNALDAELAALRTQLVGPLQTAVATLTTATNALEQAAALRGRQVDQLRGFLPLLIPLGEWETVVRRDLEALQGATAAQDGRLRGLERYRSLLVLLSVLGLLSASQVAELARTARCLNVCEQLDLLSDLPGRVEAIEAGGF